MRENRPYGSEAGSAKTDPDPYQDFVPPVSRADVQRIAANAGIPGSRVSLATLARPG